MPDNGWSLWLDLGTEPALTGPEQVVRAEGKRRADEGVYIQDPDGNQYAWVPALNEWADA